MLIIIFKILLILIFGFTGLAKIFGVEKLKQNFDYLQLPQWFRFTAGVIEVVAVVCLIISFSHPSFTFFGGGLIICVAIGAIIAHLRLKHKLNEIYFISVLGIISTLLVVMTL